MFLLNGHTIDHDLDLRPSYRAWLRRRAPLDAPPETLPSAHAAFCAALVAPLDDEHVSSVADVVDEWLPARQTVIGPDEALNELWQFARHLTFGILATLPESVHTPEPAFAVARSNAAQRQMQSYYHRLRPALEDHVREVTGVPDSKQSWQLWLLPSITEHYDHAMRELANREAQHAAWCLGYGTGIYIKCLDGQGLSTLFGTTQHQ